MHQVDEQPLETIHLYVVREEDIQFPSMLPVIVSVLCFLTLVGICLFSANDPVLEHKTIRIPAVFLPLQQFTAEQAIIPTGSKTYPATPAQGILTIYNGSILAERLPRGMIFVTGTGIEVMTDASVYIPAGNPPYYAFAHVSVHAVVSGGQGNISVLAINNTFGTSLVIRNLQPFTGGHDAYAVTVATRQDRQTAMDNARVSLTAQLARMKAMVAYPCHETARENHGRVTLSWACQFVTYSVPQYMHVTKSTLAGKYLFLDVWFVARPRIIQFK
jgi:hypothetical protein